MILIKRESFSALYLTTDQFIYTSIRLSPPLSLSLSHPPYLLPSLPPPYLPPIHQSLHFIQLWSVCLSISLTQNLFIYSFIIFVHFTVC